MLDQFDKDGNYKVFKNVVLPSKFKNGGIPKIKVGDSLKAFTPSEASRIYGVLYQRGHRVRQYKSCQGFWWVQRVK